MSGGALLHQIRLPIVFARVPVPAAIAGRRHPGQFSEGVGQVFLMRKAAIERDLDDALVAAAEQRACALNPFVQDVLIRRLPRRQLELSRKMRGAFAQKRAEIIKADRLVQPFSDMLVNAAQLMCGQTMRGIVGVCIQTAPGQARDNGAGQLGQIGIANRGLELHHPPCLKHQLFKQGVLFAEDRREFLRLGHDPGGLQHLAHRIRADLQMQAFHPRLKIEPKPLTRRPIGQPPGWQQLAARTLVHAKCASDRACQVQHDKMMAKRPQHRVKRGFDLPLDRKRHGRETDRLTTDRRGHGQLFRAKKAAVIPNNGTFIELPLLWSFRRQITWASALFSRNMETDPTFLTRFRGSVCLAFWPVISRDDQAAIVPLNRYLKLGMKVGAGSDWGPKNPFEHMKFAETHEFASGNFRNDSPDHNVTRAEAVAMWTREAGRVLRWQGVGTLEVGAFGDVAILDRDPLSCPRDDLPGTVVLTTIVGGKVVYDRATA